MSVSNNDDPNEYMRNPFFVKNTAGDFTPFYTAIGICTVLGVALILLNIFFCCCSKHKHYWQDSNTGSKYFHHIFHCALTVHNGCVFLFIPFFLSHVWNLCVFWIGNRWILPIWSKTPHLQPPLDYTELDKSWLPAPVEFVEPEYSYEERLPAVYLELQKRESDI